ncbi:unnamed protein product [Discosporangium mesarthrocarpum]
MASHHNLKVAWVGGVESYGLDVLEDMCFMALGDGARVRNPFLKRLKTLQKLKAFAASTKDRQWGGRMRLLEATPPAELLAELQDAQKKAATGKIEGPHVVLSTVHKAKGLEFDNVVLAEDFIDLGIENGTPLGRVDGGGMMEEEVNVLYVAVTRAKRRLVVNRTLRDHILRLHAWDSVVLTGLGHPEVPEPGAGGDRSTNSAHHSPQQGRVVLPPREPPPSPPGARGDPAPEERALCDWCQWLREVDHWWMMPPDAEERRVLGELSAGRSSSGLVGLGLRSEADPTNEHEDQFLSLPRVRLQGSGSSVRLCGKCVTWDYRFNMEYLPPRYEYFSQLLSHILPAPSAP